MQPFKLIYNRPQARKIKSLLAYYDIYADDEDYNIL